VLVVDQPATIGALAMAVTQDMGITVGYLPGLSMRRTADLTPGSAKTDAKDAAVIAGAAKTMPHTLKAITTSDEDAAALSMLRQGASPVNSPLGWFLFQDTHRIAVTADKSRTSSTPADCHNMSDVPEIRANPRTSTHHHRSYVSEITTLPSGNAPPWRPPGPYKVGSH